MPSSLPALLENAVDYVFYFNVFETVLWTSLGCYCVYRYICGQPPDQAGQVGENASTTSDQSQNAVSARRAASSTRRHPRLLAMTVAFWVFAISEVVETQTGAWWKPWWLAVWKGVCIAVLVTLGVQHYRARQMQTNPPVASPQNQLPE